MSQGNSQLIVATNSIPSATSGLSMTGLGAKALDSDISTMYSAEKAFPAWMEIIQTEPSKI